MTFTGSTATYGGGSMGLFATRVYQYDSTLVYLPPPWFPTIQDAYTVVLSREVAATASSTGSLPPVNEAEQILEPAELRRYADAIVKAALSVGPGDTLVIQAEPAHRELAVEMVAAGYRAGATIVELQYYDPLVTRARLLRRPRRGDRRDRAVVEEAAARARQAVRRARRDHRRDRARLPRRGPAEEDRLDLARTAAQTKAFRRANLDMRARWTGAGWPTDYWAGQVYPELARARGKRRLAQDILWFCRLTDEDGKGSTGWLNHARALARRARS